MKVFKFALRIICFALGLFSLSFGIAITINSTLGVSPVSSLPYALSVITGVSFGTMTTIVYAFYFVLQIIILRKRFKWYNIFQVPLSLIFGYFNDFARYLLGDFSIPTYFGKILMTLIGVVFIALGVVLQVDAKLINKPAEGLLVAIADSQNKLKLGEIKVIVDIATLVISVILSLIFLKRVEGVREGSVIVAALTGFTVKLLQKILNKPLTKLLFINDTVPVKENVDGNDGRSNG